MPCLDFANTADGRATTRPRELLGSYADLTGWARRAGLIDDATAGRPAATAPTAAGPALARAIEVREAIFQVFAAVARGEPVPAEALARGRGRYAEAVSAARLEPGGAGFDWRFTGDALDRPWWPTAVSAVRSLTTGPLDRVKACAAEAGCVGLFLDVSKNRSRRWCTDDRSVEAEVRRQAQRRARARRWRRGNPLSLIDSNITKRCESTTAGLHVGSWSHLRGRPVCAESSGG